MSRSAAAVHGRPRRLRLSGRLALELLLLALLITAAAGWTAVLLVRSTFARQLEVELEDMDARVDRGLGLSGDRLDTALAALEQQLRTRDVNSLEQLLAGGPAAAAAAAQLMPVARLDALVILDEDGTILSAEPWPQRVNLTDQRLLELPEGRPVLRWLEGPQHSQPGLAARRVMRVGSRVLMLVGGIVLDRHFVDGVAGAGAAVLLPVGTDVRPIVSELGSRIDLQTVRAAEESAPRLQQLVDLGGSRWDVRLRPLDDETGGRIGTMVLAVHHGRLDRLVESMSRAFLLLGGGVGLLAMLAGVLISRGITRPVRDLIRAIDAIAAGEADYTFPITRKDEIQALIGSFSRMHRSLEVQRQRSMAAERVATWRDVAQHVAHEVKNPLAPIRLTVENLLRVRREAPERFDELFSEGMQTILEEVEQLRRMVEEFSEFARLPLPERRRERLEPLLDAVLDLYASDDELQIERHYAPGLPVLELDREQIARALKNVVGNAVEAMREGEQAGSARRLDVALREEDGMLCIEVADSGPGFSSEAARRVFEPYFTTKARGTGLGMALTYRIVIEHGGVITAENREPVGARVRIRLPLAPAAARGVAGSRERGGGTAG